MVYFMPEGIKTAEEKKKNAVKAPLEYHCSKCGHYSAKQNFIASLVKKVKSKLPCFPKKRNEKASIEQLFKEIYGMEYVRQGDKLILTDSFGKSEVFKFSDTDRWMDYLKEHQNKAQIDIDGMVEMVQNYFRAQGMTDYINIAVDFVFGLVNFISWTVVAVHAEGKVKLAAITNAVTAITYIGWKIYYLTKQIQSLEDNKNKIKAVMFAAVTSMISSRKDVEINMEEALKGQGISKAEYDEAIEIVKKLVKETNLEQAETPEQLNTLPPMLIEGPKSAKSTVVETKSEKPTVVTSEAEVFEDAQESVEETEQSTEPEVSTEQAAEQPPMIPQEVSTVHMTREFTQTVTATVTEQKLLCVHPTTGEKVMMTENEFLQLVEEKTGEQKKDFKVELNFENKIFTDSNLALRATTPTGPPATTPFTNLKAIEPTPIPKETPCNEEVLKEFEEELKRAAECTSFQRKESTHSCEELPAMEFIRKSEHTSKKQKKNNKKKFSGAKAQSDVKAVTEPAPDWTSIAAKGFIWIVNVGAVVATSVFGGGTTVREALTHVQLAQTMNNLGRTAINDINDLKKTIYTTVTEPAIVQDVIIQEKITKAQQYISTPQVEIANNFDRYEDLCYFIDELKIFLGPNPSHPGISMELRTLNQLYINLCSYLQAVNVQLNNSVVRPKPAAHHFFSPESGIGKTTCITQKFIPACCAHLGKDANLASTVILDSTTTFIPPATRNCPGTFFDEFLRYGGECKVAAKLNSWIDTSRTVREGAALDTKNAPVSDRFTFFASNVPGVQLKGIPIHSQNATWGRLTQWKVVHTDLEGDLTFDQLRDRKWTRKDDFSNLRFIKYKYIPTLTEGAENDVRHSLVVGNSQDLYPAVGTMVNTTAGRYKILSEPKTADEVLNIIKEEMDENMAFYLKHKQQRELDKIQFETQIQSAKKEKISTTDLSNRFIRTYETLDDVLKVSMKSYPTSFNLVEAIRHEDPDNYTAKQMNFEMSYLERLTNQSRIMYNAFKSKFGWKSISQDSISLEENMLLQAYFLQYNVVFVAKTTYRYTFNPQWKYLYFSHANNNILPLVMVRANAQIEIRRSAHGTSNPLTILFRGPPETGKSTLAKYVMGKIASLYDMPIVELTQNDLTRKMVTTTTGETIDVSMDVAAILVDDLVKEFPNVYSSFWNTLNPHSLVFVCANLREKELKTLGAYSSFRAFSQNGSTFLEAWIKSCPRWYRRSIEKVNGWNKADVEQNIRRVDIGVPTPDGWARRLGLVGKIYSGGGISDSPYNIELVKNSKTETLIVDPVTMRKSLISDDELVEKINTAMVERQRLSKAISIEKRPNLASIKTDPLYKPAELTVECKDYKQFREDFSSPSNIMWAVAAGRVKLTKEMLEHPKLKISSSYNFVLKLSEEMKPEELKEQGIRLYELLDANGLDAAVFVRIADHCIFVNKRTVLTTVINEEDKVTMIVEKDGTVLLSYESPKVTSAGGVSTVEQKVTFTPSEVWSILKPPHVAMDKPIVAIEHMKARVQELLNSDYYKKKEAIYQKEIATRAKHIGYLKQGIDAVNIVKSSPWYLVFKITSVVVGIIATIGTLSFLIYKATKSNAPSEEVKPQLTEDDIERIREEEYLKLMRDLGYYDDEYLQAHGKKLYKQSPEQRKREYDSWKEIRDKRGVNLDETSFVKDGKISFHQAAAPKPQMVDKNMTCFYGTPAPIPDYIYKEAEKNLVKIKATYVYPGGHTDMGIGFGIMLKAADVIFPAHYVKRHPIETRISVVNFDVATNKEIEYSAQVVALNRASEIAMARVTSGCPHFKDITSHFIKEEDTTAVGSIAVHRPHSGKWETIISASSVVRNMTNFVTVDSPGINLKPSKVMLVNFTHLGVGMSYGSCGLPYIWVNGPQCRFFTGFHIAGNTDSSFGCFITQETIADLYSVTSQVDEPSKLVNEYWVVDKDQDTDFVNYLKNAGLMSHDLVVNTKQREILENLSGNMNLPDEKLDNVRPIGFSSYLFQMKAYKNRRTKVPWSSEMNDLVQNAKDHSLTSYFEGMDPKHYVYVNTKDGKKPCLKWAQILKKEDPWEKPQDFELVIQKGKEEFARLLRKQDWGVKFRTLNEYEILNGIQYGPLKGFLKSMNAGSTVGAFWSKYHKCVLMKDKYLGYVDRLGVTNLAWQKNPETDELRYFLAEAEQHLYRGVRPLTFYGDELKVELNEGKSRLFSAADVVEKYLFRKFFGTLLAFESKFRHARRTAIGADAINDLPAFMWKARQTGSKGLFSDASRFDKHVLKYVIQQYYAAIVDFMIENWEPKELERIGEDNLRKAFDVLTDMVATPIHVVNGTVYVSNRGNPSGSPNTTITNCGVADVLICAWYMKALEESNLKIEQLDVDTNLFVKMLGDDFFVVLSDLFLEAGLNGNSFSKFFQEYGSIELTSAKKDGPLEESLPLHEGSFLSRTFKPAGHNAIVWFPALKKSSIHSAMHFYTPGEERSLKEVYMESMKEAALHMDKTYYDRVCDAVRIAVRYANKVHGKWIVLKSIPIVSYEKMVSELEKEALKGIPMSHCRRDLPSTNTNFGNKSEPDPCAPEHSECVPFAPATPESHIKTKVSVKHPAEQTNRSEMSFPTWATKMEKNRYSSDVIIAAFQVCIDLAPCKSTVLVMSDSGQRWLIDTEKTFSCENGVRSVWAHENEFRCSGRQQDQEIATLITKRWQRVATQLSKFYPHYKVVLTRDFLQIGTDIKPLTDVCLEGKEIEFGASAPSAQMLSVMGQLHSGMKDFVNTPHNLNSGSFNAGKALQEFSEVSKSGIESAKSSRLGNALRNSAAKFKNMKNVSSSSEIKHKVEQKPQLKPALPEFQHKLTENTRVEEWGGRPWSKSPIDSLPEPQKEKVFKEEEAKSHQYLTIQGATDGVSSPDEAGRSPDELLAFFRKEIEKLPSMEDYKAAGPSSQMGHLCGVCYAPICSRCGCCSCGAGCQCKHFQPTGPASQMQYDAKELFEAKPSLKALSQKETLKQVHEQLECARKGISYVLPGGEVIGNKLQNTREARLADEHRMEYHRMERAIYSKLASTMPVKDFRRVLKMVHASCASEEKCTCFDLIQDIDDDEKRSILLSYAIKDLVSVEKSKFKTKPTGPKAHVGGAEMAAASPDQSQVASVPPPPSEVAVVGTSVGTLGNQQVSMQMENMMERGGTMQDVASVAFNNKIPILDIVIPVATASGTLLWKAYCDVTSLSVYAKFIVLAHIRWMPSIELTAIFVGVATYAGLLQAVLTPVDTNLTGNLLEQFLYAFNWEMLHYSSTGEFGAVLNYNFFPGLSDHISNYFWSQTGDVISTFKFADNFRRGPCWWLRAATAFVQAFENPDSSVLIKMFSRLGHETVMSLININFISTAVDGSTPKALSEPCGTTTSRVFDITGLRVKDLLQFVSGNSDFDIGNSPADFDYYMRINGRMVNYDVEGNPRWNSMQWNDNNNEPFPAGKPYIFNEDLLAQTGKPDGLFSSPSQQSATVFGEGHSLKTQGLVSLVSASANKVYVMVSAMDLDMPKQAMKNLFMEQLSTSNVSTRLDNFIAAIQDKYHIETTRTGSFTTKTTWYVEGTNRTTLAPFSFALIGNPFDPEVSNTRVINNRNVDQFTLPTNMYRLDFGPARPTVEGPGCLLQGFIDPVNSKLVSFMKKNFPSDLVTVVGLEDPVSGSRKVFILFNPEQNCLTIQLSTNNAQGYNENQRSQQLYTGGNIFNHGIVSVTSVPKSNSLPYSDSSLWQTLTVSGAFSATGPQAHAHLLGAAISKSPVLNAANGGINYGFNSAYLKKQYQYNKDLLADYNKGQFKKEVAGAGINAVGNFATSWNQRKGVENAAKTSARGNVASALVSGLGNVAAVKAHGQENRKTQAQALQNSGTVKSGSLGISGRSSAMQVGTAEKRNPGSSGSSSTGLTAVRG